MQIFLSRYMENLKRIIQELSNIAGTKDLEDKYLLLLKDIGRCLNMKRSNEEHIEQESREQVFSKDKIKGANEIPLEKFSGEENGPDFFSFKSKFGNKYKNIHRTNIPNILKSYLSGEAHNNVKQMAKLWKDKQTILVILKNCWKNRWTALMS